MWRQYEMKNKPAYVLDVLLPPGTFDINVTPDKREVFLTKVSSPNNRHPPAPTPRPPCPPVSWEADHTHRFLERGDQGGCWGLRSALFSNGVCVPSSHASVHCKD